MDEKITVLVGTLLTIIFGILASIIAWFAGGQNLQGASKEAIRKMFNFEINFLIIAILLGWIPVAGQILVLALWIANIVFAIKAYNAANSGQEVNIPSFELIK